MFSRNHIRPSEHVLRCPQCHTTDPAMPLLQLANWVVRNGKLVGIITGQNVGCRRCPATYDLGPHGVIAGSLQMPISVPAPDWSPAQLRSQREGPGPKTIDVPDDDATNEYRPPRPRPKEAPPQ